MQPSTNPERGGVSLSAPGVEQPSVNSSIQPGAQAPDTASAQSGPLAPQFSLPLPPLNSPGLPGTSPAAGGQVTQAAPSAVPDDPDVIEKEWVNKAKQIVAETQGDPFKQSKEMTVFRVDYMKKRYNKTIKLSE